MLVFALVSEELADEEGVAVVDDVAMVEVTDEDCDGMDDADIECGAATSVVGADMSEPAGVAVRIGNK